ncbi:hypothetical protein CC80DRAFT_544164 [Byssothecium circinans]|uniref:Uncharacterized protein n=1 Tax=Byssothecium circinans TaxID=147558 RepID=A0A6A5UA06_9PLEO|nr:hypothetical protein CC80DRAFT_544164 [Byssothecium circinans]
MGLLGSCCGDNDNNAPPSRPVSTQSANARRQRQGENASVHASATSRQRTGGEPTPLPTRASVQSPKSARSTKPKRRSTPSTVAGPSNLRSSDRASGASSSNTKAPAPTKPAAQLEQLDFGKSTPYLQSPPPKDARKPINLSSVPSGGISNIQARRNTSGEASEKRQGKIITGGFKK